MVRPRRSAGKAAAPATGGTSRNTRPPSSSMTSFSTCHPEETGDTPEATGDISEATEDTS